jgi:outer membrane protein assembly factor BamB
MKMHAKSTKSLTPHSSKDRSSMQPIYSIFAILALASCAGAKAASLVWEDAPGMFGPGHAGIVIGDFDGDGSQEAAVSAYSESGFGVFGSERLAVLTASSGVLRVSHVSVLHGELLVGRLQRAPAEQGADRLVGVAVEKGRGSDGRIIILGDVPLRVLRSFPGPGIAEVTDVGDLDGDGNLEILALTRNDWGDRFPIVLDYVTGEVEWVGASGVSDAKAAQLDGDAPLELVLASTPGYVLDGASHGVEWTWAGGFDEDVLVGSFAAPETPAFATYSETGGFVQVFTALPYMRVRNLDVGDIDAAAVIRLNGADQIGIGKTRNEPVSVLNPRTGSTIFTTENPAGGISALAGGNLDLDANVEIIFGAGLDTTAGDLLRVVDTTTAASDFSQYDEVGPHVAIARGPVSGTGVDEIAYLTRSSMSGNRGPNLHVLDATTGRRLRSRLGVVDSWGPAPLIAAVQADGDPQLELVVASSQIYTPRIMALDGLTLSTQWSIDLPMFDFVSSMDLLDVDGDGVLDVVASTENGDIHVIDSRDGSTIWQSVTISGADSSIVSAFRSVSGDPYVLFARDDGAYVFNLVSGFLEAVVKVPATTIALTRWGDGASCRVGLLGVDDTFRTLGCFDLVEHAQRPLPPNSVFVRAMDEEGSVFVVASNGILYRSDQKGYTPVSGFFDDELGVGNQGIVVTDTSSEAFELFIGSRHTISRIAIAPNGIFANGFE